MVDIENGRPSNVLALPRWTIIVHGVQMVLALAILALDAYGIRWIAYNALIFSLVACILTLGSCAYIVGTTLFAKNLYNCYVVFGLHILMVIFWICDMGLVANLARIWSSPSCYYSYYGGYSCAYGKRDLSSLGRLAKRDDTTVGAYYGALCAGAFFGAVQFATWVLSMVFVIIYINKQRSNPSAHAPPAYTGNNTQNVPLEQKYGQAGVAPVYQQPQQPYSAAQTPQPQHAQPVPQGQYPGQPTYNQQHQQQFTTPYAQDPVNRTNTVSPVSQAGYAAPLQNTSELASPQHTGPYNPNVSELSTPQHTGAYDPNVSELSSHR